MNARVVLGAVIIKHFYRLSDIDTIEMIKENPYLQHFIGYKGLTDEPAFAPLFLYPFANGWVNDSDDSPNGMSSSESPDSSVEKTPLYGKLQIDATVTYADIKYPTDLGLLNDNREKSECLIDRLCELHPEKKRPRTYRRVARREYLSVSKKKKKSKKELRHVIRLQIN